MDINWQLAQAHAAVAMVAYLPGVGCLHVHRSERGSNHYVGKIGGQPVTTCDGIDACMHDLESIVRKRIGKAAYEVLAGERLGGLPSTD